MKGQNLETKRQKEKMASQGACKLALSCLQKNVPHFSWRITWDKTMGMAIQDYWSWGLQPTTNQKIKIPKQGCLALWRCYTGAFLTAAAINDALNPKVLHIWPSSCPP